MQATLLTLRTGDKMPVLGLGTWKIPKEVCANTVKTSLEKGYRLLDCACDYGNEHQVGEGLKKAIEEGVVKREEVWVTSKLWNTYHAREHVKPACKKTLEDLGLKYLDLYLIHFPISLKFVDFATRYPPEWGKENSPCEFADIPTRETWEAMEELVTEGLVRNIGISNFNCQHIMDLMKYAKIKPAVLQVELHPYLQQPQLVEYCNRKEVHLPITVYSSFGGISYVPLGNSLARNTTNLLEHDVIKHIALKHKKSTAQILLRWAVQLGVAIIPKSLSADRLTENSAIFDFSLDTEDLGHIKQLNHGHRYNDPADYFNYPIFG